MDTTAILLLHCPDQQGIISEVTKFITDNKGNIVYLDQYVDKVDGMFFMRIEWELEGFLIPRDKLYDYLTTLYAQRYKMKFSLYYSDKRPRMAIFVSKMSHCLYDLLARWKAGEFNCDIPCIVSNHEDLRYVADQFGIPYYVWSIKKDHSNKAEVEKADSIRNPKFVVTDIYRQCSWAHYFQLPNPVTVREIKPFPGIVEIVINKMGITKTGWHAVFFIFLIFFCYFSHIQLGHSDNRNGIPEIDR